MILDKDQLKYITQTITPEQSTYVAQVSNLLDSIPEKVSAVYTTNDESKENSFKDIILFLNKIQGFSILLKDIEWIQPSESLKYKIADLQYRCQDYLNSVMPLFRSAYNYQDNIFTTINLPLEKDALLVIDELKATLFQFINASFNDPELPEHLSMKQEALQFLTQVCKILYEFRLAKCSADYNREMTQTSSHANTLEVYTTSSVY